MISLSAEVVKGFDALDVLSAVWFIACWLGYTVYAKRMSLKCRCLASIMADHRVAWMECLLTRDNRVADASLLANLERNVSFFASSTLLVLAGLIAALGSGEDILKVAGNLPFNLAVSEHAWEAKLLFLAAMFVYAFFKFSWSLRQYGFASVLVGRAPGIGVFKQAEVKQFSEHAAKVISRAAHAYNLGLRSYYFSLAYLVWFLNPWMFMLASSWVVGVLYRREFRSNVLKALDRVV